jgi:hypothetical protein
VRQVAAGARQTYTWPAPRASHPVCWQWQALAEDVLSSAEHEEIERLRAEFKRVE